MTNVFTAFSCQRTFVIFYLLNSDITGNVVHNYAFSCIHRYIGCRQRKCAWNLDGAHAVVVNAEPLLPYAVDLFCITNMERRTFLKLAALVPGLALAGCGGSKTLLSAKDPTMLSIWHVYGEQADSPMNRLLTEFNDTVGKEKGILLNVTNMTNSAAIGGQLQDAKAGKPGALDLPDLFSAHPSDASALGIETLVDWNDWFTAEDMAAYVPGFVQDGIIEGRQVVFPVSKSTQLIFLNGSQYARFAADTGAQLSTLAILDGFFEMAAAVFLRWLTEQQRNLEFAADTGYMPVSSAAFDAIADYPFEQQSYQRLYDVYNEMRLQNTPLSEPGIVGYHAKAKALYDSLRQRQKDYPQRLANGETLEALTEETWQLLCDNA